MFKLPSLGVICFAAIGKQIIDWDVKMNKIIPQLLNAFAFCGWAQPPAKKKISKWESERAFLL